MPINETQVHDALSPVSDSSDGKPEAGMALCLSGGGYRAMVFHLGCLWRLNELGFLSRLSRISSVSGGSITAGQLGLKWSRLQFVDGIAQRMLAEAVIGRNLLHERRMIQWHGQVLQLGEQPRIGRIGGG